MRYSIIIPTNNEQYIQRNLKHIEQLKKPKLGYEVIVVQNGDNDKVKPCVDNYLSKIQNLKYVNEKNIGLVHSRHRGAKEASGEILCYLDDDSFVEANYLLAIENTFKDENVVIAGGNNLPLYESKPPRWLKYFWVDTPYGKYMDYLSLIKFKNLAMKVPTWFVFGCNFIIRKDILYKYGGFNPDGVPFEMIEFRGDGETALSCKLNKDNQVAYFNPNILIYHYVPNARITLSYFKKRAYCQGVSNSFSDIRKGNGFEYFDFTPNGKIKTKKLPFLQRKYNKIIKPLLNNFIEKCSAYKEYENIKAEAQKSYQEGYDFHQKKVKENPKLLEWVLRDCYYGDINES